MHKTPTLLDLQREVKVLRDQHKVHAEVLLTQADYPAWQSTLGRWISRLSDLIFYIQYAPWAWLMIHCLSIAPEAADGTYNPRKAYANMAMILSGALNAGGVLAFVLLVRGRADLLPLGVGYVAWFSAITLLHAAKERARLAAGGDWENAANIYSAKLFRSFGVKVKQVTGTGVAFPLFQLVGFLPALVVGFLVNWATVERFETVCSSAYRVGDADVQMCNATTGGCCKMLDMRLDYFTFIAFLTGNVIAGYQVVKFGATCLLAFGESKGEISGGASALAAAAAMEEGGSSSSSSSSSVSALEAGKSGRARGSSSGQGIAMRANAKQSLAAKDAVTETGAAAASSV